MFEPNPVMHEAPTYSIVIPVLDERDTLVELERRLGDVMNQMDGTVEVVLVDDGSTDGSFEIMREIHTRDQRFRSIRLSRNFGHQVAITAGLDHALGEAVVIMDADLQDPPEVILHLAAKWREGFEVVYAVRDDRAGESKTKLRTASWFYRLMNQASDTPIPVDAGDFRLVDRRVVTAVKGMREQNRYLRGMFAWVGFDQSGVHYAREARHAGTTKFSLRKMVAFATDGIVGFSTAPLRLALAAGFAVSLLSFLAVLYGVVSKLSDDVVPGWTSLVAVVGFLGGIQLIVLGVMGEYIARIYDEVKQRPLYLVRDRTPPAPTPPTAAVDR